MDQQVIHSGIEHCLLLFRATFNEDTRKIVLPHGTCFGTNLIKSFTSLFLIQIKTGIGYADKGHSHAYLDGFAFFGIESKPCTNVIATHLLGISSIQFILAGRIVPLGFYCHRTHLFPVATGTRDFIDTHYKINGKHSLRIIAKSTQQFSPLYLTLIDKTDGSSRFISQPFAKIQQNITFSFRKSETSDSGT